MGPGSSGLALRPRLHLLWSGDPARVSGQALWRPEDTHLHFRAVAHPLRFHQTIGKTRPHSLSQATRAHRTPEVRRERLCLPQADIFSGALFIQVSLGWDLYLSTGILLLITAAYTVTGERSRLRQ